MEGVVDLPVHEKLMVQILSWQRTEFIIYLSICGFFLYSHWTNQFSAGTTTQGCCFKAEDLVDHSFDYLDKENVIKWNLKMR